MTVVILGGGAVTDPRTGNKCSKCTIKLNNHQEDVQTFEDGKYTAGMQICVYHLVEHHISMSAVGDVISRLLDLAGKQVSHL